jgi:hypothetical protein
MYIHCFASAACSNNKLSSIRVLDNNCLKNVVFQEHPVSRPLTSKPRDPDTYTFADENLAKDYKRLYAQFQAMQQPPQQGQKKDKERDCAF